MALSRLKISEVTRHVQRRWLRTDARSMSAAVFNRPEIDTLNTTERKSFFHTSACDKTKIIYGDVRPRLRLPRTDLNPYIVEKASRIINSEETDEEATKDGSNNTPLLPKGKAATGELSAVQGSVE